MKQKQPYMDSELIEEENLRQMNSTISAKMTIQQFLQR